VCVNVWWSNCYRAPDSLVNSFPVTTLADVTSHLQVHAMPAAAAAASLGVRKQAGHEIEIIILTITFAALRHRKRPTAHHSFDAINL